MYVYLNTMHDVSGTPPVVTMTWSFFGRRRSGTPDGHQFADSDVFKSGVSKAIGVLWSYGVLFVKVRSTDSLDKLDSVRC